MPPFSFIDGTNMQHLSPLQKDTYLHLLNNIFFYIYCKIKLL
jgi:hypothetical protein